MVEGKTIFLSLDGTLVACITDININFNSAFLSTRDRQNVGWNTYIPGQKGFEISGSGMVVFSGRDVYYLNGFETPALLDFKYHTESDTNGYWEGQVWVQTYGERSQGTGFATYDYNLLGNGKPTFMPGGVIPAMGIGAMIIETDFTIT